MVRKQNVHSACVELVANRVQTVQRAIEEARKAAASESKSTAGDKHETGRAMAQLEQEKNARQLAEAQKLSAVLQRIDPEATQEVVALGSLVQCNTGLFFISVGLGKVEVEGAPVFAISTASPVGAALLGKRVGDTAQFNGRDISIQSIT